MQLYFHFFKIPNIYGWRMPTEEEIQELIDNTISTWINSYNGSGINGTLFTSKTNTNTLFVPASGYIADGYSGFDGSYGYYWSGRFPSSSMIDAHVLYISGSKVNMAKYARLNSFPIRAVHV